MNRNIRISIIGAGRFGLFFGKELERLYDVIYYDKNKFVQDGILLRDLDECLMREIIFLAIPISAIEGFLKENGSKIPIESTLVDFASVKLKPKEYFEKYLSAEHQFMLTHPLFGPDSAKDTLKGEKIAIVESRIEREKELKLLEIFAGQLKLNIIFLSADEHDYFMAFNLSLMHHLGRAFNDMGILDLELKMKSLTDISRITQFVMNDPEQLFKDFYRYNPYAHSIRKKFEDSFKKYLPSSESLSILFHHIL